MKAKQYHDATSRRWTETRRDLEPRVREALSHQPLMSLEYALAINTTQNVIREALTASFQHAMPQPYEFFVEVAIRSACYALTALHPDDQERGALEVQRHLLNKLADMQANGHVIQSEWS